MTGEFYHLLKEGHSSPGLVIVRQDLDTGVPSRTYYC